MYRTLADLIPRDKDLPLRAHTLSVYQAFLEGRQYDGLQVEFCDEYAPNGEYVPLKHRRPSVQYPLLRNIVVESTSLLFGDGHFPHVDCEDRGTRDMLKDLIKETKLPVIMLDAAIKGSVGSIALRMRVLKGKVHFDVLPTNYLTPHYDPNEPDRLVKVVERRKVSGQSLADAGYNVEPDQTIYWFRKEFHTSGEDWYLPLSITDAEAGKDFRLDKSRSVQHSLGFVPIVWVRNLPGGNMDNDYDGACTFGPAIAASLEIDGQLSQAGRGLKYSSDPTLVIKNPSGLSDGALVRGANNAISLDGDHADAKLLEIDGSASQAVIEYVRTLREFALESVRGSRASPERLSAAQSGRALEVMNSALRSLAGDLRMAWGEGALLSLLNMVIEASHQYPIKVGGKVIDPIARNTALTLRWKEFFVRDSEDKQAEAMRLEILTREGLLSKETATGSLAESFDLEDLPAELARIEEDNKKRLAEIPAEGRQLKVTQ